MSTKKPKALTPAQHYREAEALLHLAQSMEWPYSVHQQTSVIAMAQVHATLATTPPHGDGDPTEGQQR